jgi:D-amino-acid oxidase
VSRIVILGQGVIGLTTGLVLSRAGHDVEIYSERGSFETTSMAACAVWLPLFLGEHQPESRGGVDNARVQRWAADSYSYFSTIASAETGVNSAPLYRLGAAVEDAPRLEGTGIRVSHFELPRVPAGMRHVWCVPSFVIDMPVYLAWLVEEVRSAGITMRTGHRYTSLVEAAAETNAQTLINCTGLGARALCGDLQLAGVKGVLLLKDLRQEVSGAISCGDFVLAARSNALVLGALYKKEFETEAVEEGEVSSLNSWHDAWPEEVLQLVKLRRSDVHKAATVGSISGLRPVRAGGPRHECETMSGVSVIHSYGHGGGGVTLSWGVADDTLRMMQAMGM